MPSSITGYLEKERCQEKIDGEISEPNSIQGFEPRLVRQNTIALLLAPPPWHCTRLLIRRSWVQVPRVMVRFTSSHKYVLEKVLRGVAT